MGQVTIIIDKREYAITCDDGQEAHIIKLSRILDEKAKALSASVGLINENMKLAMTGLLLADELLDLKAKMQNASNNTAPSIDVNAVDKAISQAVDAQTNKIINTLRNLR